MRLLLGFLLLAASAAGWAQSCTTTISIPTSIPDTLNAQSPGAVVCLNSGDWGSVVLSGINRGGYVTLKSATGNGAEGWWQPQGSQYLIFDHLAGTITVSGGTCSFHLQILSFTPIANSADNVYLDMSSCPNTAQDILIDGAIFDRTGPSTSEGRLGCRDCNDVTISNSQFLGIREVSGGPADGIMFTGQVTDVTVGPGNYFNNIYQSVCDTYGGAHCDTLQIFGGPCSGVLIEGNHFLDSSSVLLTESNCSGTVRNNVFDNIDTIQFHEWNPLVLEHNTFYSSVGSMNESPTFSTSAVLRSNIFHDSSMDTTSDPDGEPIPCSDCVFSYNLFNSGCTGTNCITATPTYTGGAPAGITTLAGWQLANGSAGENNAHDGSDRGTLYYGTAAGPSAPTGFRLIRAFPWPLMTELR